MNHDENNPASPEGYAGQAPRENTDANRAAELEARIVAWVAGEASAFEVAELERLVAEKPELAIFKRRIEAVQGLVGEAVRAEKEPLRMEAERREKLLAAIGAGRGRGREGDGETGSKGEAERGAKTAVYPLGAMRKRWVKWQWGMGVAATVAFGAFLTVVVLRDGSTGSERGSGRLRNADGEDVNPEIRALMEEQLRRKKEAESEAVKIAAQRQVRRQTEDMAGSGEGEKAAESAFAAALENEKRFAAAQAAVKQMESERAAKAAVQVSQATEGAAPGEVTLFGPPAGLSIAMPPTDVAFDNTAPVAGLSQAQSLAMAPQADVTEVQPVSAGLPAPIVMSPFQISADKDFGYAAGNTLSGTRAGTSIAVPPPEMPRTYFYAGGSSAPRQTEESAPITEFGRAAQGGGRGGRGGGGAAGGSSTIVMSPLEVSAERDASQPLGIAPGSVSVVTKEFLADANVANARGAGIGSIAPGAGEPPGTVSSQGPSLARPQQTAAEARFGADQLRGLSLSDIDTAQGLRKNVSGEVSAARDDKTDPPPPPRIVMPVPLVRETSAAQEAVSTFSLHVSDVSFRLAQAALARGEWPDAARVRPEEFYNAFDYGDPVPTVAEKVGVRIEQSAHPVMQQRNLVRIAMKVPATGRGTGVPLRLTVLLDTSGSMEREDRAAAVRTAMGALVSLLGPNDRVTLIGFSRQPRLLAEAVPGNEAGRLLQTIASTPPEGGTNLEEALKLAHELAARHFQAAAQNRIVLMTDGIVNLGEVVPATLAARIEALRGAKIAFDVCGVGLDGLDDTMLEALARKGDGRYTALEAADAAGGGFARQLAGAFRPAAENVKVQVRFNPARVGKYRLIGFESHRLNEADFRNDRVDAAELAAEEAAVALYQVEALPQGTGEIGEVFVRFRDAATGAMVERSWAIGYEAGTRTFDRATPTMQLAGTAALLAEKLRKHPETEQFKFGDLAPVANALPGHFPGQARVREVVQMLAQARRIAGE